MKFRLLKAETKPTINSHIMFLGLILLIGTLLRAINLETNPISLYWDEVSIGLEAYSISLDGRDMNDNYWLQPIFGSYGDFKAPVYIWITSIFVKIFGLSITSVRLGSVILGVGIIYLMYLLVIEITQDKMTKVHPNYHLALINAFLTSITPWGVHYSRIGFEASASLFFYIASIYFFIKGLKKEGKFILVSVVFGILGVYTYAGMQVLLPITLGLISSVYFRKIVKHKFWVILAICTAIVLLVPLFISPYFEHSQNIRKSDDSILSSVKIVKESSIYLDRYQSTFLAKIQYHRFWFYIRDFLENYLSHYSMNFLFIRGDSEIRQHSGYGGQLFPVLMVFFLLGLLQLLYKWREKWASVWIIVFLSGAIPASFRYEVPHASRSIYMLPALIFISSLGIYKVILKINFLRLKKMVIEGLILFLIIINGSLYYLDYFIDYPVRSAEAWIYAYKVAGNFLVDNLGKYKRVEITGQYYMPELYVPFYLPFLIPEMRSLKRAFLNDPRSSWGFPDWHKWLDINDSKSLVKIPSVKLLTPMDPIPQGVSLIDQKYFPNGELAINIFLED